jgi:hypothetical protein
VDTVTVSVEVSGPDVTVRVEYEGALSIRVVLRDSQNKRHTQKVTGSSATVTFSGLPSGTARVKAIVKRKNEAKIVSEWEKIKV